MIQYIYKFGRKSLSTTLILFKVMLPAMILVKIATDFGIIEQVDFIFVPIMNLIGLPNEAGYILAASVFTNLYGGIGVLISIMPNMEINVAQLSALSGMMLFAHALPTEQSIVRAAGASFLVTSLIRLIVALFYGAAAMLFCNYFELLQDQAVIQWTPDELENESWASWTISTAKVMIVISLVIISLYILLDILKKIGFIAFLTELLSPLLKAIGLNPKLAPLTTIGLLLGLAYGGALIIEEAKKSKFSKRDLFLTMTSLSLLHSLVEDTAIMLAIGANIWVILVGRIVFAVCFIALLVWLTNRFLRADVLPSNNPPP